MEKRTEGGDAGAGSNHDDGSVRIGRQPEAGGSLEENGEVRFVGAVRQETGADSLARAAGGVVADDADGEMNLPGEGADAGGNGIEPGLKFAEHLDKLGRGGAKTRILEEEIDYFPLGEIINESGFAFGFEVA